LIVNGGTYTNTGGTIKDIASTLVFQGGVTVNGGTVTQTGAGTIQLNNATINTALPNSATGTIEVVGAGTVGGTLTANGALDANAGLTASSASVSGGLTASAATVNGPLTANGATVNGQLHATGAVLTDAGVTSSGPISASSGSGVAPALIANGGIQVTGNANLTYVWMQRLFMTTDYGNAIMATNASNNVPAGYFQNLTKRTENWVTGLYVNVAQGSDWGLYTNGRSGSDHLAVSHVETRNGHRIVTSPIVLAPEVHVSGRARLEGGRATVELDAEVADMLAPDGEDPYRVLVTPTTRCNGLAVTSKEAESFAVEELLEGSSDAEFDWLLIGRKRRELASSEADVLPESLPEVPELPVPPRE